MFSHVQQHLTGAATALLIGASLAFAAPAGAEESDTSKCTDAAWASYNSCLVSNAAYEWAMRECDFAFQQDYAACYSGVTGFFLRLLGK